MYRVILFFTVTLVMAIALPRAQAQQSLMAAPAIIGQSDVIVAGHVGSLATEWTPNKERIQTRVTIAVDETMKGSAAGSLTLVVPGGEIDGVGEWYSHTATFHSNEEVVVFASKDKAGEFRVAGGDHGKLLVTRDAKSGAKMIQNFGTLAQFKNAVAAAVKAQGAH